MYYYRKINRYRIILVLVMASLFACDAFKNPVGPEPFSPTGTISGAIIDVATQKPIQGAVVALSYRQDGEADTSITDSKGRYKFEDVPVVMDGSTLEDDGLILSNLPYGIYIDLSGAPDYRESYYIQAINLAFESTGGDGAAVDLVSNLVIPIGKQNVSLTGKVINPLTREPLAKAKIEVYLDDAFTLFDFYSEVKLTEMETDESGAFSFENMEQGLDIYFRVTKLDDITEEVNFTSGIYTIPSSVEALTMNIGALTPNSVDNSTTFYITSITPNDNVDLSFSEVKFKIDFNKAFKETGYIRTDLGFGNGTIIDDISLTETGSKAKRSDGSYEINVEYNSDYTSIIITPAEDLVDGMNYLLDITNVLSNLEDANGSSLSFSASLPFSSSAGAGNIPFSTGENNEFPNTPVLSANSDDIAAVNFSGGNVRFSALIDESNTPIARYELYRSIDDSPFNVIQSIDRDNNNYFGELRFNFNPGQLYNIGLGGEPVESRKIEIKVKAVSENLQRSAFSNEISVTDKEDPDIASFNVTTNGSGKVERVTLFFSEPLNFNTANKVSNYTIERDADNDGNFETLPSAVLRIEEGSFVNSEISGNSKITIVLDPTEYTSEVGDVIKVGSLVVDLAGNQMDDSRRVIQ